jgi:hypothetical protein
LDEWDLVIKNFRQGCHGKTAVPVTIPPRGDAKVVSDVLQEFFHFLDCRLPQIPILAGGLRIGAGGDHNAMLQRTVARHALESFAFTDTVLHVSPGELHFDRREPRGLRSDARHVQLAAKLEIFRGSFESPFPSCQTRPQATIRCPAENPQIRVGSFFCQDLAGEFVAEEQEHSEGLLFRWGRSSPRLTFLRFPTPEVR